MSKRNNTSINNMNRYKKTKTKFLNLLTILSRNGNTKGT